LLEFMRNFWTSNKMNHAVDRVIQTFSQTLPIVKKNVSVVVHKWRHTSIEKFLPQNVDKAQVTRKKKPKMISWQFRVRGIGRYHSFLWSYHYDLRVVQIIRDTLERFWILQVTFYIKKWLLIRLLRVWSVKLIGKNVPLKAYSCS